MTDSIESFLILNYSTCVFNGLTKLHECADKQRRSSSTKVHERLYIAMKKDAAGIRQADDKDRMTFEHTYYFSGKLVRGKSARRLEQFDLIREKELIQTE